MASKFKIKIPIATSKEDQFNIDKQKVKEKLFKQDYIKQVESEAKREIIMESFAKGKMPPGIIKLRAR